MDRQNKEWETPQIISLSRGTPDESVLLHCKRIGATSASTPEAVGQTGCDYDNNNNCGACQSRSGS